VDPLRIFLYDDGLARFATNPYKKVNDENIKDTFMHLTNYSINKNSKNFIFNQTCEKDDVGHKRSIKSVFKYLKDKGENTKRV
jgi:tubulin polyglutamylase TTLL6/13